MFLHSGTNEVGGHHQNLEDLTKAAEAGCRICLHLVGPATHLGSPDDTIAETGHQLLNYEFFDMERDGTTQWIIFFRQAGTNRTQDFPHVLLVPSTDIEPDIQLPKGYSAYLKHADKDLHERRLFGNKTPWRVRDDGFKRHHIAGNTGDPLAIELAAKWLRDCVGGHLDIHGGSRQCKPPHTSWQPKRLIDLNQPDDILRLYCREIETTNPSYASLSHCWGQQPFYTLTTQNIDNIMAEKVSLSILPPSFQHAITICRRLKIKYLWIDSLCILQEGEGSTEDWLLHASEMALVYQSCVLNIAISYAGNPFGGAFVDRVPGRLQPCHVYWSGEVKGSKITQKPGIYMITFSGDYDTPSEEILAFRGWVYQERFLSPRVLYFSRDRICWECPTRRVANEYFPDRFPNHLDTYYKRPFSLPQTLASRGDVASVGWQWLGIVQSYTQCALSFPGKDKLAAVGGIGRVYGALLSHDYFAGIFQANLPWGLLWYPDSWYRPRVPPDLVPYRAPSWSWASCGVPVNFAFLVNPEKTKNAIPLAQVRDIRADTVDGSDAFGPVTGGALTIRGYLLQGVSLIRRGDPAMFDVLLPGTGELADAFPDHLGVASASGLCLLPIADAINLPSDTRGETVGLLLRRRIGSETFERVGTYKAKGQRELLGPWLLRSGLLLEDIEIV